MTSDKRQLIAAFGEIAGVLHDRVSSVDPSLGDYLVATWLNEPLPASTDLRRRHAMRIAALATMGNTGGELTSEVNAGIDAHISPSEVVEVILHTIPYAGIPKPLNCLLATKEILRKRDLLPVQLNEPTWTADERMQVGEQQIAFAHPTAAPVLKASLAEIAPRTYDYIVTAAFADVYGRPGLTYAQRQPATIVSLAAQGNVQNHLTTHVNGALNIGLDPIVIVGALVDALPLVDPQRILESVETAITVLNERPDPKGVGTSQMW